VGRRGGGAPRALPGASLIFKRRFADVVGRQLDLFEREHAGLIADCAAAERAYDDADRDEAEERYGDYLELVATAAEVLEGLRDHYAGTLDDRAAEEYVAAFDRAVARRLPRFAVELD
jgi:hypothetical protein